MPQKGVTPPHLQKKRRGKKTNLTRRHKGCDKNKKRAAAATKDKISEKGKRKACDTIEPSHDSPKKMRRAAAEQAETKRREQMADASKGCECDAIGERAMRCAIAVHFSRILDFPDRGKWAGKGGAIREIMTHFRIPDRSLLPGFGGLPISQARRAGCEKSAGSTCRNIQGKGGSCARGQKA